MFSTAVNKNLRNILFLTAAAVPLSGCLVPPLVSVAAIAIDAGSFAATGKTAKDHGISLVAQEDCAILRVFEGEMCRPYSDYEDITNLAALEPLAPGSADWADATVTPRPARGEGILGSLDYTAAGTGLVPQSAEVPYFKETTAPATELPKLELQHQTAALPTSQSFQVLDEPLGAGGLGVVGYISDSIAVAN